jgi:hypothetical protein
MCLASLSYKILCRLFFAEHFGTHPPEVIFTSVSSDPTFTITMVFGPHGVNKLTFTRQRAGEGAGGDADDGVAAAEATYCHQRMHRSAKGGGGESATSESMVEQ